MAGCNSDLSEEDYYLHRLVWRKESAKLSEALKSGKYDKERLDPRHRSPLMLSVTLGHLECTEILLNQETNVNVVNGSGWTVVQEAVSTGEPQLLQSVLQRRDRQRYSSRVGGIPQLLHKLKNAPDFYVEMKWEFTSWVPLLSRMCPSDTYKVYKQGSNVRIDTTLLGFDQSSWVRGNRTYIFSGHEKGAELLEIDHDSKTVYCEEMKILSLEEMESMSHTEQQINARLTTPLVQTYLDTEKINFERSKSGIWGWGGSDKNETVNGFDCKVFAANNVELVTKSRTEHMSEEDKKKSKSRQNPLQSFLGYAEVEESPSALPSPPPISKNGSCEESSSRNPFQISEEEYFSESDLKERDIGRPHEMSSKVQKFKAQLWLSEEYPLSLQEQIMPMVDLMAISNTHFQKLKDFITCSFPAGFPVKIEIPLFHVLNARITFGNIFGIDSPVDGITVIEEPDRLTSVVNDSVFRIPPNYAKIGGRSNEQRRRYRQDEADDQLLQYAISASLATNGNDEEEEVDIYEALSAPPVNNYQQQNNEGNNFDVQFQRAIEESLMGASTTDISSSSNNNDEDDLSLAIALSQKEHENQSKREKEEQELLEKILKLSMDEK